MRQLERFFGLDGRTPRWISFLAGLVRPDEIRLVCLVILFGVIALNAASWVTGFVNGKTIDGRPAGADFIAFYNGGRILNEFGGARLYDLALQDRLYHEAHPWDVQKTMWFVNAPFLAQAFRPLALLPYPWACVLWSVLSAGFYAGAVSMAWPRELPFRFGSPEALAAASFPAFTLDAWTGGQLSPLTALVLAGAYGLHRDGHRFFAGAVLALSLYKPTIAVPLVAFLVIASEWRAVAGYVCGAAAIAVLSLGTVGLAGVRAFGEMMAMYGRFASTGKNPLSVEYRCIDLNHLARALSFGRPGIAMLLFALLAGAVFVLVAVEVRRMKGAEMWAAGITSALLLNLYAPSYDATLLAVSGLITAGAAARNQAAKPAFLAAAVLLYVGILALIPVGRVGVQPYTVIVSGFLAYQLAAARAGTQEAVAARAPAC